MDLSSDSDDCQLYTRTAHNISIKKKLLEADRDELALRMKFLSDDLVPGFSHVFERLNDSPVLPVDSKVVSLLQCSSDDEDDIPLSQLKIALRARPNSRRGKEKATKNTESTETKKSNRRALNNTKLKFDSRPNNKNETPTIILDDDTDYATTSFAPIHFNSNTDRTDNDCSITLDELQANYDDVNYEDLDTLVKISVDWRNKPTSEIVGSNMKHFKLRRYQKFETVYEELGKMEGLPINRVVLMRNFETIRPRDTPASLNLTYYGHLVGQISETEVDHNLPKLSELVDDYNKPPEGELKVKLLLDSKTSLSLTINKSQKMNILYKKCSEELKIPDYKIKISFDGEEVQQQDTVSDLGIEDGDAFEVLIKKAPAPPELLRLVTCRCTKTCARNCGCIKRGLSCTDLCIHCVHRPSACNNTKMTLDQHEDETEDFGLQMELGLSFPTFVEALDEEKEDTATFYEDKGVSGEQRVLSG